MVNSPVIVADLNPFNVVYGRGAGGVDHFVLIDGIGHKNLIPLERMSARDQPLEQGPQGRPFSPDGGRAPGGGAQGSGSDRR